MNSKKLKVILIISPLIIIFLYFFTALYSFHQFHKGIYYNDKKLIKDYVEWDELRENFKNYINIQLLKNIIISFDKDMRKMSNIVENLIRRYGESRV